MRKWETRPVLHLALVLSLMALVQYIAPLIAQDLTFLWWLALIPALFSNPHWLLIHEAIHGLLFKSRTSNEFAGRLLCILIGSPLGLLRAGHLLHHKFSRTALDRTEVVDYKEKGAVLHSLGYYGWILGGLYFTEVLGSLVALLPGGWVRAMSKNSSLGQRLVEMLLSSRSMKIIRLDAMAALACFVAAFWFYGDYWYVLLTALLMRGLLISMLDNVYHYSTPLDNPRYALNLSAPAPMRWFLLNANYHGIHHENPRVPWDNLAEKYRNLPAERKETVPLGRQWLRQLKGPIPEEVLTARK